MNALTTHEKYGATNSFRIIGVPSNQFGLQEPGANTSEIMNGIKWVRPGGGFVPNFQLSEKKEVNGKTENKMYTEMKRQCLPVKNEIGDPKNLYWTPIKGSDVQWNFEKFLIGKDGKVRYRIASSIPPDHEDVINLFDELLE